MADIHDFDDSFSVARRHEPDVLEALAHFFPGCTFHPTDLEHDRAGMDWWMPEIGEGVEAKVRPTQDDGDVLLEIVSNDRTGAPGWAVGQQAAHWLLMCWLSFNMFVVFDFDQLRALAIEKQDDWREKHGVIKARNRGYNTISIPVPWYELTSVQMSKWRRGGRS